MNKLLQGIGCGSMGRKDKNEDEAIELIRKAAKNGRVLLDTADFYGSGASERVIGKAVSGIKRENFEIIIKFGSLISPSGQLYGVDVHPDRIKNYLAYSLQRLGLLRRHLYACKDRYGNSCGRNGRSYK